MKKITNTEEIKTTGLRLATKNINVHAAKAFKDGLVMIIPVLLIGAFTLVFKYFPIKEYQSFITELFDGLFISFLDHIYNATFGMLSVYITATISYSFSRELRCKKGFEFCATITALIAFFILTSVLSADVTWDAVGVKGMFVAIVSSLGATKLYFIFSNLLEKKKKTYTDRTDSNFNTAVSMIFPAAIVCGIFAVFNVAVQEIFNVSSFYGLFVESANALFEPLGRSFWAGLLFVLVSSFLWFFGIHGSNVLESVMSELFTPALQINLDLIEAGAAPSEILSKQFFDVFILMGGCGTAICLIISIFLFSKRKSNLRLSRMAALPMLFNINEIMIFGLPVILNVTLLIPFVLTPIVSFLISYAAMDAGIVPLVISDVNWTIPVIFGGYIATNSLWGSLLQIVNIAVGVLIYRPFIMAYDRKCEREAREQYDQLVETLMESELSLIPVQLSELGDRRGAMARTLIEDIRFFVAQERMQLYYQPQYDNMRECIGTEALLRWKHPLYGTFYPPLVIQLAREDKILGELEEKIFLQAIADCAYIKKSIGRKIEVSVNVSAETIFSNSYMSLLKMAIEEGRIEKGDICLEITEQTALIQNSLVIERLDEIKKMGYTLAIDDFSMGHTSLAYLQKSNFDVVKLDGSLIKDIESNERNVDIIKSIVVLSKSLGFGVISEYVETETQRACLESIGCVRYQGYLYSPAIPKETLTEILKDK